MISVNLGLAIRSMQNARVRSVLTMLGVMIATATVVLSVNLLTGMESEAQNRVDQLGGGVLSIRSGRVIVRDDDRKVVQQNPDELVASPVLTFADLEAIQTLSEVESSTPFAGISASIRSREDNSLIDGQIIATTSQASELLNQGFRHGAMFDANERSKAAVLGYEIAEFMFGDSPPIGRAFKIGSSDFIVRGVFERFPTEPFTTLGNDFNNTVFIAYASAGTIGTDQPLIREILVKTNPADVNNTALKIENKLLETHDNNQNFSVLNQEDLRNVGRDLFKNARLLVSLIALISLIVGGVGIMNTMLVSVSERTREVGIRKAIGATNRQIMQQFLTEAVVLSSLGGLLGIILAQIIGIGIRSTTNLTPAFNLNVMAFAVVVSIFLGIIFGAGPAWKAASKKPIDALRS